MSQKWLDESSILDDLDELSVIVPNNDETYLRPITLRPPALIIKEEEPDQQYSECSDDEGPSGPDLNCITSMLRMVGNNYSNEIVERAYIKNRENINIDAALELETYGGAIIKKKYVLNPEVPEFTPLPSSNNSMVACEIAHLQLGVTQSSIVNKNLPSTIQDLRKDIRAANEVAKKDPSDYKAKRNRNVAIDSLMRMMAEQPQTCQIPEMQQAGKKNETESIKLLKPEDFQLQESDKKLPKVNKNDHNSLEKVESSPEKCKNIVCDPNDVESSIVRLNPESSNPSKTEVISAFRKVEDWLSNSSRSREEPKTQPKHPSLNLPFGFTKKKKMVSPLPMESTIVPANSSASTTNSSPICKKEYMPSKNVESMYKKYEKRLKAWQGGTEDIWARTEREMKAKDEAIRQKLLQENPENVP